MVNILVRDVPEVIHARLVEQARERGQSLQQYVRATLVGQALRTKPRKTMADLVEKWQREAAERRECLGDDYRPLTREEIVAAVRAHRDGLDDDDW